MYTKIYVREYEEKGSQSVQFTSNDNAKSIFGMVYEVWRIKWITILSRPNGSPQSKGTFYQIAVVSFVKCETQMK